jgi:hypothetical protein
VLDLPVEEIAAGVAAPKCAVAIEDGDLWAQCQYGLNELQGPMILVGIQKVVPGAMVSERSSSS